MKLKSLSSSSLKKLREGFSTLNQIWKRGLLPEDLKRHYTLHWFVVCKGNIIQTAQALQIHRNTIQDHFLELGFGKKTIRLRHTWQKLSKKPSQSFKNTFHRFYHWASSKPKLSPAENAGLISLWQSLFPYKVLVHHFLLWSLREKKGQIRSRPQLGYSYRHQARLLSQMIDPKTKAAFWLSPLKPTPSEIYSPRYKSRLRSRRKKS